MEPVAWWNFCIYNFSLSENNKFLHTPIHVIFHSTRLQELSEGDEEGGNASGGNGQGRGSAGGGGAGAAAGGAGGGAGLAVGGGGVRGGGLAVVGTTDDTVVLHLLEGVAGEGTVGGLNVEATVNLLEGTHAQAVRKYISRCTQ